MRLLRNSLVLSIVVLASSTAVQAKNKKAKVPPKDPQDEIEVVGRIPSSGGPVSHFVATQHYSNYYLYAEHEGGKGVTLIDITDAGHPAVLADIAYPPNAGWTDLSAVAGTTALVSSTPGTQPHLPPQTSTDLSAVAGTTALVSSTPGTQPHLPPQTMRLMDFSDPRHPKVTRDFTGITAMARDDRRGLIFLANADGIWILHQELAEDPEVKRAYEYYVIYGPSMYPAPK